MSSKTLFILIAMTFVQWFVWAPAQSQSKNGSISEMVQYKISHWATDDGLPSNSLIYLHQDADDYLWIGSFDGLVRFDGTRFSVYSKNNTPELQSFHCRVLSQDLEENLWIGTGFGLVKHKDGKFTNLAGAKYNFFIESMLVNENDHTIWLGTRNSGLYLYDIKKNMYASNENKFSKDLINSVIHDGKDGIWVGSEKNGLGHYSNGAWNYFGRDEGLLNTEVNALFLDDEDGLLIATTTGLFQYNGSRFMYEERFNNVRINKIKKDSAGNLWILTVTGAHMRDRDGNWKVIDKNDGLSNNDVRDILFDTEGNIWLATYRGGLNQVKEVKFITFAEPEGLIAEATGAICQLGKNKYMVGTTDGKLYTIDNGSVKLFPLKTPLTQRIYSLLQDDLKNLWITSYDGLVLVSPDGKEKLFTEKDGLPTRQLRVIMQDKKHQYWIGSRPSGIIKMEFDPVSRKPSFQPYQFEQLTQLNATFTMSIDEDAKGNLLVGSNTGGMLVITPDGSIQNYSLKESLVSNVTYSVRPDKDGVVWIATSDGLGRLENGNIFNYTRKDGMPYEGVYDLQEDSLGYCWLPSPRGIIRVLKKQLNDYKEGKIKNIEWKLFDKNEDLIKAECTGATRMFKDSDDNLWFLMLGGVVALDPSMLLRNTREPNVFFESLTIDEKEADLHQAIEIPAGSQRIEFTYSAISLRFPKGVRYKYRMENFDRDWIDAGTERQTVYTNLPPGSYIFNVIACNNDGLWNTKGARVAFTVLPHFYQTTWFYGLVVITFVAGIFTYIRWRTWEIKQRAKALQHMVEERTREISSQRDELVVLNEELRSSQEEVMAQRDSLEEKNGEIERMNTNLEKIVAERTRVLEDQNEKLAEYAFINAHKLRAPLASILGIINLLTIDTEKEQQRKLLEHLDKSSAELDNVIRSINQMLEEGFERKTDEE